MLFIAPLLVALWSGWYLGERVTLIQWIAIAFGFLGVVIIVRPGGGLLTITMLLPLGAAACFALYQLITRRIGTQDSVATSNMISALVGVVCTSVLLPAFWTHFPEPIHLAAMIVQGTIATLGHLLLTQAYRFTSPVILAPFSYLHILFAGLFGMLFFNHVPDTGALLGMVVIALSGLGGLIGQRSASKLEVPHDVVR
ncbi:Riboflavin transporter [compost metagenome]